MLFLVGDFNMQDIIVGVVNICVFIDDGGEIIQYLNFIFFILEKKGKK